MPTTPTLAEREAIIAEQQLEVLRMQLAPLQALLTALQAPQIQAVVTAAQTAQPNLNEYRFQWAANLIAVLHQHPADMVQEVQRIQALIDAASPPAAD